MNYPMAAVNLTCAQFAFTISFHFIFPAFLIVLANYLTVLEGLWLKPGKAQMIAAKRGSDPRGLGQLDYPVVPPDGGSMRGIGSTIFNRLCTRLHSNGSRENVKIRGSLR